MKAKLLLATLSMILFIIESGLSQNFYETMGAVSGPISIGTHESNGGFDNDIFTMSGNASLTMSNSSNLSGSSGGASVLFSEASDQQFVISGINTSGLINLNLNFSIRKVNSQSNGNDFKISYSINNGVSWTELTWVNLGGVNPGAWALRSTSSIPSVSNLSIRFNNSTGPNAKSYQIDDVRLSSSCNPVSMSGQVSHVTCNGGSNGSISISAEGTGPISYSWSNGSTSGAQSSLSAGIYTLTASNACGTVTQAFTVSEPAALSATSSAGAIACFGGSTNVEVAASGGTAPYTGIGSNTVTAGNYSYTVTDANGCSVSTSITVSEPALLTANAAVSDAIECYGGSGAITVFAAGGTAPYSGTGTYNVIAGDYSYTVADANGCTALVDISISQPEQLVASSSVTDAINCYGESGVISVTATGGTPAYAGTGDFTVTAGTYDYIVTDANGCEASTSTTITEPEVLLVDAGNDLQVYFGYPAAECFSSTATATGGTPSYSYEWSSNGEVQSSSANLMACPETSGAYSVTVTDANGCSVSDEIWVCVVDVVCQAGNSNNYKVEMCQIPPGNPNNAHTICIDASAVPAHLAIGCTLGACGELESTCGAIDQISTGTSYAKSVTATPAMALTAYPNPTEDATEISLTPSEKGDYLVVVSDMSGRIIAELFNGFISDFENITVKLEMTAYHAGVYMINVIGNNGSSEYLKIVKK